MLSYEVAAAFRIVDDATAPLRRILEAVRELNTAIKGARDGLAQFSTAAAPGLSGAITQVNELAVAWERVASASRTAAGSSGAASASSAAAAALPGGGRQRLLGGGGAHITGP